MRLKDREAERTDWSTEPEASFSPEEFHANECTFFLWPRYSLVSRPPGQSTATMRRTARAWRRREPEGCERANTLRYQQHCPHSTLVFFFERGGISASFLSSGRDRTSG